VLHRFGGGLSGQAGAVRHGISKALTIFRAGSAHAVLSAGGFLTRDRAWSSARSTAMQSAAFVPVLQALTNILYGMQKGAHRAPFILQAFLVKMR
jgi:hypothetical protein